MILRDKNKVTEEINKDEDDVIIIEKDDEEESNNNVVKTAYTVEDKSNYQKNQPFFKNKWLRLIAIILFLIILIVIFLLIFSSCNASKLKGFTVSEIPVLYAGEEQDLKIVPSEDLKKAAKYKFKVEDESIAKVKYAALKGKTVKNTIIPVEAGETKLNIKAGKAKSSNKLIVCNHLSEDLADTKMAVKLNKTSELDLGLGENKKCYKNITAKADDEDIIEVDGMSVKAKKPGNTTITVSDGTEEIKIQVKVSAKAIYVTSLTSNTKNFEIKAGESKKIDVNIKPDEATNKELNWTSSDKSVATVENGVVKAKKAGVATITAETTDGTKKSLSFKVKVNPKPEQKSNSSSSKPSSSSSSSAKATYYQYRLKKTSTVPVAMCKYQKATYYEENFYSVSSSYNRTSGRVSNSIGVRLKTNSAGSIKVIGHTGKEYYNQSSYCAQRVRDAKVYWPGGHSVPTSCSNYESTYMIPGSYVSSGVNVSAVSKGSRYANGYEFTYSYSFYPSKIASFASSHSNKAYIPTRFTVKYYGYGNAVTGKCSAVGKSDKVLSRYTENKTVTTYGDYQWSTNRNIPNAEYTGATKVQ